MVVAPPYCSRKKESVNDSMLKLLFLSLSTSCLLIHSSYSFTSVLFKEIDTVVLINKTFLTRDIFKRIMLLLGIDYAY